MERVDRAYKAYFDNKKKAHPTKKSLPKFKKRELYKSFTLKQAGYKFEGKGCITINGKRYRYFDSRPLKGKVKTLTVKRDNLGDIYILPSRRKNAMKSFHEQVKLSGWISA